MRIFCNEYHPNQSRNMEITDRNVYTFFIKVWLSLIWCLQNWSLATTFCRELLAEFHENPRNTLFADARSWTDACTKRCGLHERHYFINLYRTPNKNCRGIYEETESNSTKPNQCNSLIWFGRNIVCWGRIAPPVWLRSIAFPTHSNLQLGGLAWNIVFFFKHEAIGKVEECK